MKIEIKIEKDNPFMKRKEIIIEIDHEGGATPTKANVQKEVAKIRSVSPEHVDVRKIFSKRGVAKSEAKIFIWEEPKVKDLSKEAEKKVDGEEAKTEEKTSSGEANSEKEQESKENESSANEEKSEQKEGGE